MLRPAYPPVVLPEPGQNPRAEPFPEARFQAQRLRPGSPIRGRGLDERVKESDQ